MGSLDIKLHNFYLNFRKKLNTHIITMNAIISSFFLAIAVCSISAQPLGGLGARFKTPSQVLPVIGTENPIGALGGPGISYGYGPSMGGLGGGIGGGIGIGGGLPFGGMMGFGLPFGMYGSIMDGPFASPSGPPAFGPHRNPFLFQIIPSLNNGIPI